MGATKATAHREYLLTFDPLDGKIGRYEGADIIVNILNRMGITALNIDPKCKYDPETDSYTHYVMFRTPSSTKLDDVYNVKYVDADHIYILPVDEEDPEEDPEKSAADDEETMTDENGVVWRSLPSVLRDCTFAE